MRDNLKFYEDFNVPLDITRLQNAKLKLVPFESDFESHAKVYYEQTKADPSILQWIPYGPWESLSDFKTWYAEYIKAKRDLFWFAIILHEGRLVKRSRDAAVGPIKLDVQQGTMAGITGLCRADPDNSCVEIGHVLTFPAFWGTMVTATAHGLLLHHLLDPAPDLHFRRVQWQANMRNMPSRQTALRLGFQFEGIIRWQRIIVHGKPTEDKSDRTSLAEPLRSAVPGESPAGEPLPGGRHTAMFSFCWDDWVDGGKQKLRALMSRYD